MHASRLSSRLPRFNVQRTTHLLLAGVLAVAAGGCKAFLDPSELGTRLNGETLTVKILDSVEPAIEEPNREFARAEPPRPEDLEITVEDYRISPNDILQISVGDLQIQGADTIVQKRVSQTGRIKLPLIDDPITVEGLSEIELEQEIAETYEAAGFFQEDEAGGRISVQVIEARGRAFSVTGAVLRPGFYTAVESDFRLLDAMTLAGDVANPTQDVIYVLRKPERRPRRGDDAGANDKAGGGAGGRGKAKTRPGQGPTEDDLAPDDMGDDDDAAGDEGAMRVTENAKLAADLDPDADADVDVDADLDVDADVDAEGEMAGDDLAPDDTDPESRVTTIDGREIPVRPEDEEDDTVVDDAAGPVTDGGDFEFNEPYDPEDIRIIRIPLDELKRGALEYNIAIRPQDQIVVPQVTIGEFYMGGHVLRPGAYSLTAREITLMEAVISAGGLDALGIPHRTDLVRRVGRDRQVFVRVDLAKIFEGTAPDIYLKPNDKIIVGTEWYAPFLAAIRGGFRMTYGFGFIYDRNFAYDRDTLGR